MLQTTYRLGSLALVLLLGACGGGGPTDVITPKARDILIAPIHLTLNRGETGTASAVVRDVDGNLMDAALTWTSSDPAVATVTATSSPDQLVTVTAVSLGTATITAACCGSVQATLGVTVGAVTGATWVLDSISGGSTLSLTQSGGTLNATIVFNPPAQVSVGDNAVSSGVNATLTSNPPPTPPPALDWIVGARVTDVTTDANAAPFATGNKHLNANPTGTDTITASGTWTIPATYQNLQTLRLRAFGVAPISAFPNRDAWYHKVTP